MSLERSESPAEWEPTATTRPGLSTVHLPTLGGGEEPSRLPLRVPVASAMMRSAEQPVTGHRGNDQQLDVGHR